MQSLGEEAEKDVVKSVTCPNCQDRLELLPRNNPLFDVQCKRCIFRAQVKAGKNPKVGTLYGASWEIMNKTTKSGYSIPQLIIVFKWQENDRQKQEIRFYPFIQKDNLKPWKKSKSRITQTFNYVRLKALPYFYYTKGEWKTRTSD